MSISVRFLFPDILKGLTVFLDDRDIAMEKLFTDVIITTHLKDEEVYPEQEKHSSFIDEI
jgi:hypothetical protein